MKTRKLAAVAAAVAVVPALVSFGCNKKEDIAPAPSATQAPAPPPPPVAATPAQPPTPTPAPAPARVGAKVTGGDGGARDGATVVVALPDAAAVAVPALPQIPNIPATSLPAIASGIVGGIVGALPSGLIPPPAVPDK